MKTEYFVYVLYSVKYDRYYIGQTQNVLLRMLKHNKGHIKSTRYYIPWELVYTESYESRSASVLRERELKSWKSKIRIRELVGTSR